MRPWNKRPLVGLILVLAALLVHACGGGEEAAPTPQPTATLLVTATPARVAPTTAPPTAVPSASTPTPARVISPTFTPAPTPTTLAKTPALAGKLRVAAATFFNEQIRPALSGVASFPVYGAPMYDWLTWDTTDGSLVPGVLTRWDMAADGKSWTVVVREGMKFHTGDPLTAEDVKFTIEQVVADVNKGEGVSADSRIWQTMLDSVQLVGPTTLRINLKGPWALMAHDISVRGGPASAVIPKAYFQRVGSKGFDTRPVGTGPWRMTGHDTGIRFTYEASGSPHPYRESPKFQQMDILLVPEESTRLAMLRTGEADMAELANLQAAGDLQKRPGFQIFTSPALSIPQVRVYGIDDNRIRGLPTARREVRQAMDMAINKEELVETIFGGLAPVAPRSVVAFGTLGFDPSWKPTEFNPARARELLAQAGYPNGISLKAYSPGSGGPAYLAPQLEAVVGYWANVGIRAEILRIDYATLISMQRARPQPDALVGNASSLWSPTTPTNITTLRTYYHSKGTTLLLNRPDMDELIDRAVAELDEANQIKFIRQIVDMAYKEFVTFPTANLPGLWGAGPRINSWKPVASAGVGVMLETVTPR